MMPYAQGVEEARYQVEQAMADGAISLNDTGDQLDPEQEKEIDECNDGDDEMHHEFSQINPDDHDFEDNLRQFRTSQEDIKKTGN